MRLPLRFPVFDVTAKRVGAVASYLGETAAVATLPALSTQVPPTTAAGLPRLVARGRAGSEARCRVGTGEQ